MRRRHRKPAQPAQTADKALTSLIGNLALLFGVTITHGTAQLVAGIILAAVGVFSVWRVPNRDLGGRSTTSDAA